MTRKYGIDLLKIVSMIMVVVLHIYGTGGVLERLFVDPHSLKNGISNVVHTFCMMAVDCFVLATGYIMCEHRFKYSRILKLWGTVVFYGLTMTSIAAICCPEIDIGCKNWLKAALPVGNDGYWFFTQYVALFFMIPFLNHLLKTLPGKQMHILLITGFALLSFYPSLCHADLFKVHLGYSFVWFMYLYVVAGYLAIYKVDWRINTKIVLLALGGGG